MHAPAALLEDARQATNAKVGSSILQDGYLIDARLLAFSQQGNFSIKSDKRGWVVI